MGWRNASFRNTYLGPREKWPRAADGAVEMFTRPLDLDNLLAEAQPRSGNQRV